MNLRLKIPILALLVASSCWADDDVDFNNDIRPIFSNKCYACHGPDEAERKADLRLDTQDGSREDLGDYAAIVPGDVEKSELFYRVSTDDVDDVMPPAKHGEPLSASEVDLIKRWIEQGAEYAIHWAYVKPKRAEAPGVSQPNWPKNDIDRFLLARLDSEGMKPMAEADRYAIGRRLSLDLTGLPPTIAEVDAFVADKSPEAYGNYVDALLAKPAFGEHWTRMWLDLARYADSAGYADDPTRTIWAYRDWVIKAINENMPFDQFTIEQIAGDLLENPTDDQVIATAFNRNTMTNSEGGTNDEEFRNVAVVDRVNTTMAVWMGTTAACAQCHTHKFDPITQAEYFQLFAFFNQSEDADRKNEEPLIEMWSDADVQKKAEFTQQVEDLKKQLASPTPELAAAEETWLKRVRQEPEWTSLKPLTAKAEGGDLQIEGERVVAGGEKPDTDTFTVELAAPQGKLTGLRLEIPAEQTDNFVLSQVGASFVPENSSALNGKFVRVELPGKGKFLHLAEAEVFSGGSNIAPEGTASQISTGFDGPANLANDGNTEGDYAKKSVSHTGPGDDPWWEVDLGGVKAIERIVLWNRMDATTPERIKGYRIQLLDADRAVIWENTPTDIPKPSTEFDTSGVRTLKFARAFADFEQAGFAAQQLLAAKIDPKKGWAIGGQTGKPHELTLIPSAPVEISGPGKLVLTLRQKSEHKQHLLTHFQVSTSASPQATEWARMPYDVRDLVRADALEEKQAARLAEYFRSFTALLKEPRAELAKVEKQLTGMKATTTIPIMRELAADKQRKTNVQVRGNFENLEQEVQAATPVVFHPLADGAPTNRLALANWLVDKDNPLTARVVANRYWEAIFGIGIVSTPEEFGSQGELPFHPDLLDWLATELVALNWDTKEFLKLLVSTAAYRQRSEVNEQLLEADPENRLLARGPRFRLSAEMIRDQALAASGLLSDKMYGPPVKPPQPQMGLKAAFGSATDWQTSMGDDKFRRGLYTTWRRSNPYPSMATFDAPNREVCAVNRSRTNTPLQALVTLNDPVYVEAAQALGRSMAETNEVKTGVVLGFRRCLSRPPTDAETEKIVSLHERAKARFAEYPDQAKLMAEDPLGPLPEGADAVDLAAWTVVGNVLLNLDEMFMKR
ncbi:MAG: hypothetical protein ACI8UO_002890 [Verrucomicrobiales bacterium]|jgi:hypothetical protein